MQRSWAVPTQQPMSHYAHPADPARMERMQSTYRPGAFFSYFGIPGGTSRAVYAPPAAVSPQKKLGQLKQLLDQGLITAEDFAQQKGAVLSQLVNSGESPKFRGGQGTGATGGSPLRARGPGGGGGNALPDYRRQTSKFNDSNRFGDAMDNILTGGAGDQPGSPGTFKRETQVSFSGDEQDQVIAAIAARSPPPAAAAAPHQLAAAPDCLPLDTQEDSALAGFMAASPLKEPRRSASVEPALMAPSAARGSGVGAGSSDALDGFMQAGTQPPPASREPVAGGGMGSNLNLRSPRGAGWDTVMDDSAEHGGLGGEERTADLGHLQELELQCDGSGVPTSTHTYMQDQARQRAAAQARLGSRSLPELAEEGPPPGEGGGFGPGARRVRPNKLIVDGSLPPPKAQNRNQVRMQSGPPAAVADI